MIYKMLEFSILDFVLTSALCYMLGVATGLAVCCQNKETFLQRERSVEDLQRYNHQSLMPPPDVIASAPPPMETQAKITIH